MSALPPGDADLIAASHVRPEAFDEVFRRHFADVYRFAARQLGTSDGEEAAAETFARAFAQRSSFAGTGSARAWLFGICINVMRGHRRSGARQSRAYERAYEPDPGASGLESMDGALDARVQRERLLTALGELRTAERDALVLYALAGLSYHEIAEALRLPLGTVRSHLFRARGALRTTLQPIATQGGSHE